jgi:hypothetical protein
MKGVRSFIVIVFKALYLYTCRKNSNTRRYLAGFSYCICLMACLAPQIAMSQAAVNNSGNWDDSGIWNSNNIGDVVTETVNIPNGVGTITIPSGTTFTIGELTMRNSNTLTVSGTLNVGDVTNSDDMICYNSDQIIVNSSGSLTIWGDLDVKNNLTLTINGDFLVKGDVILDNNASLVVNGTSQIDGNFSSGTGASLTVNSGGDFGVTGNFTSSGIAVTVNDGGSLDVGENFNVTGASTINGDGNVSFQECTGTFEFCDSEILSPGLPVKLLNFKSKNNSGGVVLQWVTASEINNDYFSVERSEDGEIFYEIGKVTGNGTTNVVQEYVFKDEEPISNLEYYRLKQVDYDEAYEYSPILIEILQNVLVSSFEIYPNPARSMININSARSSFGHFINTYLQMINNNGQQVAKWSAEDIVSDLDISGYQKGIYYLRLVNAKEVITQKLLIID